MDMSVDAIDLIDKIMQLNPLERLGFGEDGFKKIKSHKFFESIDFEKIQQGKISPPIPEQILNQINAQERRGTEREFF